MKIQKEISKSYLADNRHIWASKSRNLCEGIVRNRERTGAGTLMWQQMQEELNKGREWWQGDQLGCYCRSLHLR